MKGLAPVLAAGGTFAVTALIGLLAGIVVSKATAQPLWVFAGLMAGVGIGGYGAVRLLLRSLQ